MPQQTDTIKPLAVRPAQAAEMLGISRLKIYKLISGGRLRAKKEGNTRLIMVADLEKFLQDLPNSDEQPAEATA